MARQTLTLPGSSFFAGFVGGINFVRWGYSPNNYVPIDSEFAPVGTNRFFSTVGFESTGEVELHFSSSVFNTGANHDLTAKFEANGGFTLSTDTSEITVLLAGVDMEEPYIWTPANSAEVIALYNAFSGMANVAATLTLFDFTIPAMHFEGDEVSAWHFEGDEITAAHFGGTVIL